MYNKWDIWLAEVPFEDINERKTRPILVIEGKGYYIDCWKMTSNISAQGSIKLIKWKEAGLNVETSVILSKKLELSEMYLHHKIGVLHPFDILRISTKNE